MQIAGIDGWFWFSLALTTKSSSSVSTHDIFDVLHPNRRSLSKCAWPWEENGKFDIPVDSLLLEDTIHLSAARVLQNQDLETSRLWPNLLNNTVIRQR